MKEKQFFLAISHGDLKSIVDLLSDEKKLVNAVTESGKSAFELSLAGGFSKIALMLIDMENFLINHEGHNPLRLSIELGYIDIAIYLLEKGANPNYKPNKISSPLLLCLDKEYFNLANLMIEKGAEVNTRNNKGWTPLIWASIKGYKKSVDFLLKHNASIHICNDDGWNAITGAYFKKRTNIFDTLMAKGAVFSATYAEAALLSAYENGYLDVVNHLLEMEVNPNVADDKNISLLAKAIIKDDNELILKMVGMGADINDKISLSRPLLSHLAKNGKIELIQVFIKAGADVNLAKDNGATPLHNAVLYNQIEAVELLLKNGANINAMATSSKFTPLMIAAQKGYLNMVILLLKNNANAEIETNGKTAKVLAKDATPVKYNDILKANITLKDNAFTDIMKLLTLPRHYIYD